MCFDYDGSATLLRKKTVVARKNHQCHECGNPIWHGLIYERSVWLDYEAPRKNRLDVFKCCSMCLKLRQSIHDAEVARGCSEGEAWPAYGDILEAALEGAYPLSVKRLYVQIRRYQKMGGVNGETNGCPRTAPGCAAGSREIAKDYGVSQSTVRYAIHGRSWRHVR